VPPPRRRRRRHAFRAGQRRDRGRAVCDCLVCGERIQAASSPYNWQVSSSSAFSTVIPAKLEQRRHTGRGQRLANGTYFWRVQA